MQKKAVKKEVQKIMGANDSVIEFLQSIELKYVESDAEKKAFNDVYTHLKNMNVLFQRMGKM